jgi:hypothetical protein
MWGSSPSSASGMAIGAGISSWCPKYHFQGPYTTIIHDPYYMILFFFWAYKPCIFPPSFALLFML